MHHKPSGSRETRGAESTPTDPVAGLKVWGPQEEKGKDGTQIGGQEVDGWGRKNREETGKKYKKGVERSNRSEKGGNKTRETKRDLDFDSRFRDRNPDRCKGHITSFVRQSVCLCGS